MCIYYLCLWYNLVKTSQIEDIDLVEEKQKAPKKEKFDAIEIEDDSLKKKDEKKLHDVPNKGEESGGRPIIYYY